MTPAKLRAWFGRQHVGGARLRLVHEGVTEKEFASWPIPALLAQDDPEKTILDACKDLADSLEEAVRVAIQIVDEDETVLATTYHKQVAEENAHYDGDNAANVSQNTIVAQLLRHIEAQQKVMTHSQGHIYSAFEKTIAQLQKANERQAAQIQALNETIQALRNGGDDDSTPEDREEAIQRANAWAKVGEIAPVVLELAANYANSKINGAAANGASNGMNGHSAGAPAG